MVAGHRGAAVAVPSGLRGRARARAPTVGPEPHLRSNIGSAPARADTREHRRPTAQNGRNADVMRPSMLAGNDRGSQPAGTEAEACAGRSNHMRRDSAGVGHRRGKRHHDDRRSSSGHRPGCRWGKGEGRTGEREPGSGSMRRSAVRGRRCARSPLTGRTSLTPRNLPRSGDAHCPPGRPRRDPQGRYRMIRHPGHIRLGDPHPAGQLAGGGTAVERLPDRGRPDTAKRGTLPARRPHQVVGERRPFDRVGHLQYIVTGHGDRWLRAREVLATPRATVIPTQTARATKHVRSIYSQYTNATRGARVFGPGVHPGTAQLSVETPNHDTTCPPNFRSPSILILRVR